MIDKNYKVFIIDQGNLEEINEIFDHLQGIIKENMDYCMVITGYVYSFVNQNN